MYLLYYSNLLATITHGTNSSLFRDDSLNGG
ncbi:unnamed protein product, partial [Rotaria sordida]